MKKFLILCASILVIKNAVATPPDTLHIMNTTNNYTLYFNTIVKENACYPEIREYNLANSAGYCDLPANNSISFFNYNGLAFYYPGIEMAIKNTAIDPFMPNTLTYVYNLFYPSPTPPPPTQNYNWSSIIYKVEKQNYTEGAWIGFSDFYSCHGLFDYWGTYLVTQTYATMFTIGNDRYFIVGDL